MGDAGKLPVVTYPRTLSEWDTMEAAVNGASLARIGDGELRLAFGEKHIAQAPLPPLAVELRRILKGHSSALVCIPNHASVDNGKPVMWGPTRYGSQQYVDLYDQNYVYGSSFVCRPDSAPYIDTDEYWTMARKLWFDKDIILVIGTRGGSLTHPVHAASVEVVWGPERDAFAAVPQLEAEIYDRWSRNNRTVLLALGPAATILAHRLSMLCVHAVDIGHLGRFMPQKFQQRGCGHD